MKNDLTNEEKKDNNFSESHLKRIKIGSRILFIFAMILLIIMLLVGIVLLVEKDFNLMISTYINNSNIINNSYQCMVDLIDIARECDKKINDKTFDVWEEVLESRKNNK